MASREPRSVLSAIDISHLALDLKEEKRSAVTDLMGERTIEKPSIDGTFYEDDSWQ
jgi:hypothetical protein